MLSSALYLGRVEMKAGSSTSEESASKRSDFALRTYLASYLVA